MAMKSENPIDAAIAAANNKAVTGPRENRKLAQGIVAVAKIAVYQRQPGRAFCHRVTYRGPRPINPPAPTRYWHPEQPLLRRSSRMVVKRSARS
jgi:hypothetical protein